MKYLMNGLIYSAIFFGGFIAGKSVYEEKPCERKSTIIEIIEFSPHHLTILLENNVMVYQVYDDVDVGDEFCYKYY